jgi:hypothetical protein
MTMKIRTKVIHEVEYNELERLVRETYKHDFSFVADQELSNDSSKTFNGIDGVRDDSSDWDVNRWKKWVEDGCYSCMSRDILNDLAGRGLIPPGDYVIQVSW